jgi:nicotinamidase-related amidase
MKTAVLVIDVQQALCSGDDAAFEAPRVIERINVLTGNARAAGAPVVFIQHEEAGGPLAPGSAGWQLAEGLQAAPTDLYLRKTATDSFHATELHAMLQRQGVRRLVVCGLQSDFCVDTTTRRALALGYPVVLVSDAHTTVDNGLLPAAQISRHHELTLSRIDSFGPRVTPQPAAQVAFGG